MNALLVPSSDPANDPAVFLVAHVEDAMRLASRPDWDGEGADPLPAAIGEPARRVAAWIAEIADLPPPDIGPDPGGTISFEWAPREGGACSLAVKPDGRLIFAAFDRARGIEIRETAPAGDELPESILEGIRRIHAA